MKLHDSLTASKLLLVATAVAILLLSGEYRSAVPLSGQKERPKPEKKSPPPPVVYECPMHAEVKSESKGTCPKCKMNLEKKRGPKTIAGLRPRTSSSTDG